MVMSRVEDNIFIVDGDILIGKNNLKYLNHGCNADVYRGMYLENERAFKIFRKDCQRNSLTLELYNKMNSLILKRTLIPEKLLYSNSSLEREKFDGYIMQLLDEDVDADLLNFSSERLLDEVRLLETDAEEIGSRGIFMYDVKPENSIITSDKEIWISDIDMFQPKEYNMSRYNLNMLQALLRMTLVRDINLSKEFTREEKLDIKADFFGRLADENNYGRTPLQLYGEMFENTDSPKEYFKKRLR